MNDLYSMKKRVDDLYDKIPLLDRDNDETFSPQRDAYNKAVNEFVKCGQEVFEDDSLSVDQIVARMNQYSVSSVKELLTHQPQDILAAIREMDNVKEDAFMRLDYCLTVKKNAPEKFESDKMFASDRAYLAAFSEDEIANFEAFQDFIKTASDEVIKGK